MRFVKRIASFGVCMPVFHFCVFIVYPTRTLQFLKPWSHVPPPPPVHAFTVFARWVSILTARRLSLNVACVSVCVCALFCKTKYSVRVCAFLCIYCILCSGIEKVRCARRLSKTLCRCVDDCLRSCMRAGTLGLWKRIVGTT